MEKINGVCVNLQFNDILDHAKANNLTWNQSCAIHEVKTTKINNTDGETTIGQ